MKITQEEIDNWFTYHPPSGKQAVNYEALRSSARQFANVINRLVPDCADKTHSLRVLRDSVMWANAAIACNPETDTPGVPL